MTGFSWSQLGAFVGVVRNVSPAQLDAFSGVGGRWIVPVVYDDPSADDNLANINVLKENCVPRGIRIGGWFNVRGNDPVKYATDIKLITTTYKLSHVVVDAEAQYQGNTKLTSLVAELRKVFPLRTKAIGISTNSMNDSQVYNGRVDTYEYPETWKSFRDLNVRVLPQWYSSPRYWGIWTHADQNMAWVAKRGMEDNWLDVKYSDRRAVRRNMIHGTLEVTGLEGASLKTTLDECVQARLKSGLGKGISIYLLENAPLEDFALLDQQKGFLYSG
jgi:hypothetical protein